METPATVIPNGTFTVQSPTGEHRTFRIRTQKPDANFAPGKRILALMNGPDNTSNFMGFAFVGEDGIRVWEQRHSRDPRNPSTYDKYAAIVWSMLMEGEGSCYYVKGARIESSLCCLRCNRLLTHPESLKIRVGPECVKYFGGI